MYPRLYLARNLLREDGVIFISIDDNEQANLKLLCDEIFGAENFVDTVIWKKRYGGGAKEKHLVSLHEYTLVYAKNKLSIEDIYIPLTPESIKRYYILKDEKFSFRGGYRTHPLEAGKTMGERQNLVFDIQAPDGTFIPPKRQWLWGEERVKEAISNNELEFIQDKNGVWSVHTKQYLKDEDGNIRQGKAFSLIDDVFTQHGTNEILDIFGNAQIFSFPKPSGFLFKLLQIGFNGNKDGIVLDFFAGSGTTAHAVLDLNEQDGGNRQFICVQMPEVLDETSEAYKAGYCTIADICKTRITKVVEKIQTERESQKQSDLIPAESKQILGFKSFKLAPSNFKQWRSDVDEADILAQLELFKDSEHPHSENYAMLIELLLKAGLPLTTKVETHSVDEQAIYSVESGKLLFFFDDYNESVKTFIFTQKPKRVVCLNRVFKNDDQALTNFQLGLKDVGCELQII
jgi:adenine-specific DNA-methyltransferase